MTRRGASGIVAGRGLGVRYGGSVKSREIGQNRVGVNTEGSGCGWLREEDSAGCALGSHRRNAIPASKYGGWGCAVLGREQKQSSHAVWREPAKLKRYQAQPALHREEMTDDLRHIFGPHHRGKMA